MYKDKKPGTTSKKNKADPRKIPKNMLKKNRLNLILNPNNR